MKFIPILFSTPMVQAILEGRKTHTRRITKIQSLHERVISLDGKNEKGWMAYPEGAISRGKFVKCPYGQPGDVLWVREKWCRNAVPTGWPYHYHAGNDTFSQPENETWKPSIHMPKAACRIFLQVNSIRVERLHQINEMDAISEGIVHRSMNDPKIEFQHLWQLINGEESWNANPWVWVVEFERIDKPENFPS